MDELDEELLTSIDAGIIRSTALSKKINASLSTIHFRTKRLEKEGIIKYYKGEINWVKAGFPITAFIFIVADDTKLKELKKTPDALLKELLNNMYVREGYVTAGDFDIILKIIAKDTTHLKEILLEYINTKGGIGKTRTTIALT